MIQWVLLFLAIGAPFRPADSGYLLTTPRRWTIGTSSQICVVLTEGAFAATDSLKYNLTEAKLKEVLQITTDLLLPEGSSNTCIDVDAPDTEAHHVTLAISGSLAGDPVSEAVNITFTKKGERTFLQTDKYLYKPGQKVQFRILSVKGPKVEVSTDNYEVVYINNPAGTRIAQWLNVSNSAGLVHLSFDIFDEAEDGTYTIGAKLPHKNVVTQNFKISDYVLPRYEVTIEAPTDILGSDTSVTLKLCAKYTFGEPVNGNATLSLAAGSWRVYANLTESKLLISGCENFTFQTNQLHFDDNNCHIRVNKLRATAIVVEDGTDVEIFGSNQNIYVNRQAIKFQDESSEWKKKPYLPFSAKIATTYPDNKPAKNETMEVCAFYEGENVCKNFTTCDYGYLTFVMPSQLSTRVEVRAVNYPRIEKNWNNVMEESRFYKYSYSRNEYIDPTNSSLTVYVGNELQCNTGEMVNVEIPIVYVVADQLSADLYYQVISRGQVVSSDKTPVNFITTDLPFDVKEHLLPLEPVPELVSRGVYNLSLSLPSTVSPKISVLVWYVSKDGIVVADSRDIEISACLPHKVDFSWSAPKVEPGKEANLVLSGANDAFCSIGVVDKSVELLSSQDSKVDIEAILGVTHVSEVAQWDSNQLTLEYCLAKYNKNVESAAAAESSSDPSSPPTAETTDTAKTSPIIFDRYQMSEAIHMFTNAGYYVLSNLVIERHFCDALIIEHKKSEISISHHTGILADVEPQELSVSIAGGSGSSQGRPPPAPAFASQDFDNPRQKEGVAEVAVKERSYLPETWLWLLKPLSATGELNEPVTLPDTITEWVGSAVCVHPSEGVGISQSSSIVTFTPFFVDLTLPSSATRGEILPIKISVFNYLDEDLPVKVVVEASESHQFAEGETGIREICVPSKIKVVETIKVTLAKIGDTNLTIEAGTNAPSAGTCGSGTPPTKKDRFVRSLPVEAEGYPREKTWTKYICAQDYQNAETPVATWTLEAPEQVVEGSDRAWITAIGDLLGPSVENINNLVALPSGCGEQNMVKFAPNIYIMQYLDVSNQTTEAVRHKLIKYLNSGYQRQLLFRDRWTGSYSAFGERDVEGSTWLTAFVVKSFSQAKPYTYIDETSLKRSADWLKSLQTKDGCFTSRGRVINKMLQGGIKGSGGSPGLLAAYVLAALIEEGTVNETIISSALKCIETETSVHPYSLALKAYTLALAKSPNAKTVIDQLIAASASNSSDMLWDLPDRKGQNTALHVETAAYALLALVTFDPTTYVEESRKIVRWISDLRNGQGGFISTQDTVVALQALAAFEKSQPTDTLNMVINVNGNANDFAPFTVTEENKLLQQRIDIPTLPSTINLDISGQGCTLVQGVVKYNVLADTPNDAFNLRVETKQAPKDCKTNEITACANYTLSDGASNMAIIEVKLITGYVPLKNDLKEVIAGGTGLFKRYEVDGPKVFFYLDEITAEEVCAVFRVYQEEEIESPKPGSVSVYDYYQPEFITTQKYTFPSQSCSNVI